MMKKELLWILLFAAGCKHMTAEQKYADHINDPDNKMIQRITVGEITATAKWLPDAYRRLISNSDSAGYMDNAIDPYYYFDVKFDKRAGDKPDKDKVLYLNFDMQKDFVLVKGRDSILPAICQKIENGIGGSYQYILAFEKGEEPKNDEGFNLIYHDKIFGTGTMAFVYNQTDIEKIPVFKKENIQ